MDTIVNFRFSLKLFSRHFFLYFQYYNLSQWDETGGGGTSSTVSDWGVSDGELTQVVAQHFRSDFNLVEGLTVVDTDDGTDHFWDDDHVSQVGLDNSWLLVFWTGQLSGSQLLHETVWLTRDTTGELSSNSSWGHLDELLSGHLQQLLQVDTSVGVCLENSLLRTSGLGHR